MVTMVMHIVKLPNFVVLLAVSSCLGGEDTYTVEEAIDKCGFGLFQVKLSCITGVLFVSIQLSVKK